jgi:hypothetical protein
MISGAESTKDNIFETLLWLQDKVKADADATAVIYYSGHGMVDNDQYYLIPYDIGELRRVRQKAIKAEDMTAEIASIQSKRMLVILDCCHAGGMDIKSVDLDAPPAINSAAFPIDLPETKGVPAFEPGSKDVSLLAEGEGRAILNSSTGSQSSYMRKDGKMSMFTYHLIEALTGHAPHEDADQTVLVTDVMSYVTRHVEQTARTEGRAQTPVMRTSGVFPIAQLIGGQGLAKGMGAIPPDPLEPLPPVGTTVNFNQQGQTVSGTQINAAGDSHVGQIGDNINTGGGAYVSGINTGGGEFTMGNKTVNQGDTIHGDKFTGDKVMGDQVGGDKISVGNISGGQGIAIGRGASANVSIQQGLTGNELNHLFAPLLQTVAQQNPAVVSKVQELKEEAGKGEGADDEKMADLIDAIAGAAPTAVEGIVNLFTNSIIAKSAGAATNYILKRIRK